MKDLHSHLAADMMIGPASLSADNTPAAFDLLGFNSAMIAIGVGIGGITFDATDKIEFVLTHSDDDVTYTNVELKDVLGLASVTSGIVHSLVAAHAAPTVTRIGYKGSKRYLKLLADFSGTHAAATPIAAILNKSHAELTPVS